MVACSLNWESSVSLAYSVFLEELSLGLFSVMGLLGNSDFLDNVRREKISVYKNRSVAWYACEASLGKERYVRLNETRRSVC